MRLVMVFKGYALTTAAADLVAVPRYGAGGLVLHRAVLGLVGVDHVNLVALHTILGVFGAVALIALLARFRPARGAVGVAALLLALTPLLIKDHRSESLLVLTTAALWPAALLWDRWLLERGRLDGLGATLLVALAAMTRPEMVVIAPLLLAALLWVRGGLPRARWLWVLPLLALYAALVTPHTLHIVAATAEQAASGALPAMEGALLERLLRGGVFYGAIFEPSLFPLLATALAAAALLLRPSADGAADRRLAWALWLVAGVWMVVVRVDMPRTSIPRLHAPAAALICLAAGLGAANLLQRPDLLGLRVPRRLLALGLALGLLASAAGTVAPLWRTTNEDEAEAFLRLAMAALPEAQVCLLRLDGEDEPPPGKVHRDFPDYLALPPVRNDRLFGLAGWQRAGRPECAGGVWFVHGLRCYARADGQRPEGGAKARDDAGPIAACAGLLQDGPWQTVLQRDVPNHGDNEFGYYPDDLTFRLGLYRLQKSGPM